MLKIDINSSPSKRLSPYPEEVIKAQQISRHSTALPNHPSSTLIHHLFTNQSSPFKKKKKNSTFIRKVNMTS